MRSGVKKTRDDLPRIAETDNQHLGTRDRGPSQFLLFVLAFTYSTVNSNTAWQDRGSATHRAFYSSI